MSNLPPPPQPMNIPSGYFTPPSKDFEPIEYDIVTQLPTEIADKIHKKAFDRDEKERQRKYWETPIFHSEFDKTLTMSPKDILEKGVANVAKYNIRKNIKEPWHPDDGYYLPEGEHSRPTTPKEYDYFGTQPQYQQVYKTTRTKTGRTVDETGQRWPWEYV
jgi:hypothetical protein